jgi:hypothetical protein
MLNWKGALGVLLMWTFTGIAASATISCADQIEFERTPPCMGIHSIEPGSGSGCPEGMREDFTVQELRAWYAKQNQQSQE